MKEESSGKTHTKILKLLYRSFDSNLSKKQKKSLDDALKQSKYLRDEKELILSRRKAISDSTDKAFRPYFADRVMAQIAAIGDKTDAQDSFYEALMLGFRRLAVVGTLAVIALLFFNIIQGHIIPMDEAFYASDLLVEEILNLPLF